MADTGSNNVTSDESTDCQDNKTNDDSMKKDDGLPQQTEEHGNQASTSESNDNAIPLLAETDPESCKETVGIKEDEDKLAEVVKRDVADDESVPDTHTEGTGLENEREHIGKVEERSNIAEKNSATTEETSKTPMSIAEDEGYTESQKCEPDITVTADNRDQAKVESDNCDRCLLDEADPESCKEIVGIKVDDDKLAEVEKEFAGDEPAQADTEETGVRNEREHIANLEETSNTAETNSSTSDTIETRSIAEDETYTESQTHEQDTTVFAKSSDQASGPTSELESDKCNSCFIAEEDPESCKEIVGIKEDDDKLAAVVEEDVTENEPVPDTHTEENNVRNEREDADNRQDTDNVEEISNTAETTETFNLQIGLPKRIADDEGNSESQKREPDATVTADNRNQSSTNERENDNFASHLLAEADPENCKETVEIKGDEDKLADVVERNVFDNEPVTDADTEETGVRNEQENADNRQDINNVEETNSSVKTYSATSDTTETSNLHTPTNIADDEGYRPTESEKRQRDTTVTADSCQVDGVVERECEGCQNATQFASATEVAGRDDATNTCDLQTLKERDNEDGLLSVKCEQEDAADAAEQIEENPVVLTASVVHYNARDSAADLRQQSRQEQVDDEENAMNNVESDKETIESDEVSEKCRDVGAAESVVIDAKETEVCQHAAEIVSSVTNSTDENDPTDTCKLQLEHSVGKQEDISVGPDECEQEDAAQSSELEQKDSTTTVADQTDDDDDASEQHGENGQEEENKDMSDNSRDIKESVLGGDTFIEADSDTTTTEVKTRKQGTEESFSEEIQSPEDDNISSSSRKDNEDISGEIKQDDTEAQTLNVTEGEVKTKGASSVGDNVAHDEDNIKQVSVAAESGTDNSSASQNDENVNASETKDATAGEIKSDENHEETVADISNEVGNKAVTDEEACTITEPVSTTDVFFTNPNQATGISDGDDKARHTLSTPTDQKDENASRAQSSTHSGSCQLFSFSV